MPTERLVLCGSARQTSRKKQWREAKPVHLQIGRRKNHVHLKIEHITKRMAATLPDVAVDLVEIASYVYVADQVVTRGGTREFDYGLSWRRHFRFEIPVRCPNTWNRPDVQAKLAEVLGFVSDDDYEFAFSPMKDPPALAAYLFNTSDEESDFEEVALFSGGLDSFGGAVQEIVQGQRKVALVSHRPVSKLYSRQRDLIADIVVELKDRRLAPLHVAVEINKGKDMGRDFNQRSRSFLFASLGAVVASALNLSRIRFYENGIISLNLPISPQVIGGRATRTTHPRFLQSAGDLFSLVFQSPFTVENPYLWKTKAEVLADIKAANCGSLCARTSSCTHTLAMTTMHSHCGRCSQCVDRWITARAAGLNETEDPEEMYELPVLLGARDDRDFTLIERYVGTAREIDRMGSANEFLAKFGEASRVLNHLGLSPQDSAEAIFNLYKRHARQVCHVLSQVVSQNSDLIVSTDYPGNSLLAVAVGREIQEAASPPADPSVSPNAPGRKNARRSKPVVNRDKFQIEWNGRECILRNTKEFWLFERINRRPGIYLSNETLAEDVWEDDHVSKNTIQRTFSNLRRNLRNSGMSDLEIDGSTNQGHYALKLPGR